MMNKPKTRKVRLVLFFLKISEQKVNALKDVEKYPHKEKSLNNKRHIIDVLVF